jgi:hypothetical protein
VDRESKRFMEVVEVRVYGNTVTGEVDCIKEWGLTLQGAKGAQDGNIRSLNISCRKRGLNIRKLILCRIVMEC